MHFEKAIRSCLSGVAWFGGAAFGCARLILISALLACISAPALASTPVTAIVLFDGPNGASYVQVNGLTVNGKAEVRICDGVAKIDKRIYDTLPRVQLAGATSLERGSDGLLNLIANAKPSCAVPGNLKFDRNPELTPAEAGAQSTLQGTLVSSSAPEPALPEFKPGVKLVFVAAPDVDLAEFLRAQRADSVKDWQAFLSEHSSSAHLNEARIALTELDERAAEAFLAQYQRSGSRPADISLLKQAYQEARAANQVTPGFGPAAKLVEAISRELDKLLEGDRAEFEAFEKALQGHTPGYSQLVAARRSVEQLLGVRPDYAPVLNLSRDIAAEDQKLDGAVRSAESLVASSRYDDALASLGAYTAFATEIPRVNAVIDAAYKYHLSQGQQLAGKQDWDGAVVELRKAVSIRKDSQEAAAALDNAVTQLAAKRDREAADRAIRQSKDYAGENQFIEAYNVLAELPDPQRALVAEQVAALTQNFVAAASRRAQKIQDAHLPIKGRADEDAVREAYVLLDRASSLSGDPAVTLKRDFLSSKITSYFIEKAGRYFDKPLGSGAGMGWLYLREAQQYGDTLNTVKDQMVRYAPLYQRRARLSVGIAIRDQTSRRDSPGFADQLTDAIANGLESSGLSVDVVRRPGDSGDLLQPNFLLVGEILEHRVVKNASLETPQSKYRAGTHEVKNPAWLQASSDYLTAQRQLAAAQQSLADAQSQHKKKDVIAAATEAVQAAQKQVDESRHKLETTDQNRTEAIVEPYHYTRKTVDLSASIDLSFHINDRLGNPLDSPATVHKENHKTAVVLTDVKPEDTEGITNQSVEPDEAQFLTDLEINARNALVAAVEEKTAGIPARILQEAQSRAQRGDVDGAAEEYVMYLNSTPQKPSPERDEASKFLRDQFNLGSATLSKL
jgi:hypothetical protein